MSPSRITSKKIDYSFTKNVIPVQREQENMCLRNSERDSCERLLHKQTRREEYPCLSSQSTVSAARYVKNLAQNGDYQEKSLAKGIPEIITTGFFNVPSLLTFEMCFFPTCSRKILIYVARAKNYVGCTLKRQ